MVKLNKISSIFILIIIFIGVIIYMSNKDKYVLFQKVHYNIVSEKYEYSTLTDKETVLMQEFLEKRNSDFEIHGGDIYIGKYIGDNPELLAKYTKDFENEYLQDK